VNFSLAKKTLRRPFVTFLPLVEILSIVVDGKKYIPGIDPEFLYATSFFNSPSTKT